MLCLFGHAIANCLHMPCLAQGKKLNKTGLGAAMGEMDADGSGEVNESHCTIAAIAPLSL